MIWEMHRHPVDGASVLGIVGTVERIPGGIVSESCDTSLQSYDAHKICFTEIAWSGFQL